MTTEFGDSYQALIGKIEQRLASRSREARRESKTEATVLPAKVMRETREDSRRSREKRNDSGLWVRGEEQGSVLSNHGKPAYMATIEREIYRTRSRILEEERKVKEEPEVGGLIHCIMPVVMEQVKRYLSTFKKELISELRKEMSRSMGEKLEEIYQAMNQLNDAIVHQKTEMQEQFERALESLVN